MTSVDDIPVGYKKVRVPWKIATRMECGAFVMADVLGAITSTAVMSINDQKERGIKHSLDHASKSLSKTVFLPHLDWFEHFLGTVCKLEACKPDYSKTREERAEVLARTAVRFSAAFVASMAVKLISREALNNHFGIVDGKPHLGKDAKLMAKVVDHMKFWNHITKRSMAIFAADEILHLGSMLTMTTVGAKHTDHLINGMASVLQGCGMSEKSARDAASTIAIYEIPNIIGASAAAGVIAGSHKRGWLVGNAKDMPIKKGEEILSTILYKENKALKPYMHDYTPAR